MPAIAAFRHALVNCEIDPDIVTQIMQGYERISDKDRKEKRAVFFAQSVKRMDQLLPPETCRDVRDGCACSKIRFHYQIALGVNLVTKCILSSSLASLGHQPCRFMYEIVDA